MQGLNLSGMERIRFFKLWIWQKNFRLIIRNYHNSLVQLVVVGVVIFFENLPTVSLPSFFEVFCRRWLIAEFPTRVKFLSTNCRTAIKRCKGVALQLAKWWHCTHCSIVIALWQGSEKCLSLYYLHKVYYKVQLEEVHKGNAYSYTVCTEIVPLNVTVVLSAEQCGVQHSDRLLFYL
jgi:hypothetical protein